MTANPLHVALYCQGTFDTANPTYADIDRMVTAAADISASGFGTVILGQWHVHDDGSIWYNRSPISSVIQMLKVIPTALTLGGSVQKVLIDFGPDADDYDNIAANLSAFKDTMAGVVAMTGIDGFDWDLEAGIGNYGPYHDLLVDLGEWARSIGCTITAPPYQEEDFWNGIPGMSWWNLQTYGGADYGEWVRDAESFIVPGYSITGGASPSWVGSQIAALHAMYPALDGGFVWRYEDIRPNGYTTSDYANAIVSAAGGFDHSERPSASGARTRPAIPQRINSVTTYGSASSK